MVLKNLIVLRWTIDYSYLIYVIYPPKNNLENYYEGISYWLKKIQLCQKATHKLGKVHVLGELQYETKGQFLYQSQIKRSTRRNLAQGRFHVCVSVSSKAT